MAGEKKTTTADERDAQDNKYLAALSYIHILFLVPLLAKKESKFCQFHAKQGLVLFVVQTVVFMVAWFPLIGWMLAAAAILVSVIGVFKVLAEEYWEIPYLHKYSQKIKI